MRTTRRHQSLALLTIVIIAAFAIAASSAMGARRTYPELQLGVRGPAHVTKFRQLARTPISTYAAPDSPNVLSVLVTDQDSDWLALAHGLEAIGVPFSVTTDPAVAMQHRAVLAYPVISGRLLSEQQITDLVAWNQAGGTLIATGVLGGMTAHFGFANPVEARSRQLVNFTCGATPPCSFTNAAEQSIRIGSSAKPDGILGSVGYTELAADTRTLAAFDDGSAAVTQRAVGSGRAMAIGIDIGQLIRQGHTQRAVGVARFYANAYQPSIDVWLRLIQGAYREVNPDAVTLSPTPNGKELTVMLTHDVDFYPSFKNSYAFALAERRAGVKGTYFIQTKYITDWEDRAFLTPANNRYLRAIKAMGHELASHSVSHSDSFDRFVLGTGRETYPSFRPTITSKTVTRGSSVLGELRVSRFLLERMFGVRRVTSFRSGYLHNPKFLVDALQSTGYATSSTNTANDSLTHLGYRALGARGGTAEANVFEIPIAIEDQLKPAMPKRLGTAIQVANALRAVRGSYNVLIHPSITGFKLDFQTKLTKAIKPFSHFTTTGDYGAFLAARADVSVRTERTGDQLTVVLTAPRKLNGLSFLPPTGAVLTGATGTSARQQADGYVVLGAASGEVRVIFTQPMS